MVRFSHSQLSHDEDEGGLFEGGSSADAGSHTCHRPFSSPDNEGCSEFDVNQCIVYPCRLRAVFGSPAHTSQSFQSKILKVYAGAL